MYVMISSVSNPSVSFIYGGTRDTAGSASAINYIIIISAAIWVCMGVSPQHNHKHKRLVGPPLYYTREAGSACAMKTINSCHEYPK